jgi:uroporphyrinogen-III synthase
MTSLVLLTRPLSLIEETESKLRSLGYDVLCEPLLDLLPLAESCPSVAASSVVITSQASFPFLQSRKTEISPFFSTTCYCVGKRTAQAARDFGFTSVTEGQGGALELINIIMEQEKPAPLLCPGAKNRDGGAFAELEKKGFSPIFWSLYEAKPRKAFSSNLLKALKKGALTQALFFSPRTGQTFTSLLQEEGLSGVCGGVCAVVISKATAREIEDLPWKRLDIADRPDMESMLECLTKNHPVST